MEENVDFARSSPRWLALTRTTLEEILVDFLHRQLPHRRLAKLAGLLLLSSEAVQKKPEWAKAVVDALGQKQQHDGGWVDCEDTTWCSFVISSLGHRERLEVALRWLEKERSGDAWGYCQRDVPCIPITSTIALLCPALFDARSTSWLRSAWSQDLQSPVQLSYKAAWYLLADKSAEQTTLRETTKELLLKDQRPDGGWGPWRDHPAPSDCFCTGISMWALALQKLDKRTGASLKKALQWCEYQCLPNGLFPTHFIEEGSAWIYLGCSRTLKQFEDNDISGD
jgi:hypothetical protein